MRLKEKGILIFPLIFFFFWRKILLHLKYFLVLFFSFQKGVVSSIRTKIVHLYMLALQLTSRTRPLTQFQRQSCENHGSWQILHFLKNADPAIKACHLCGWISWLWEAGRALCHRASLINTVTGRFSKFRWNLSWWEQNGIWTVGGAIS